ncbi:hypothetical protein [Streptomyces tailanensis]|uniref:hypothetical protein n=1 Tax=Streptomyces tailanensis TaxID=2569858 RepID=UPI00122DE614|nr:hypothetical protein [Streptomyces tailanensis]
MKDRAKVEELLVTSDLQAQTSAVAWKHVEAEYVDIVEGILATLAPSGPYAYTVVSVLEEGKEIPTQRIVATYEDIENSYRNMHRYAAVVGIRPVAEINTSWYYTFVSGSGRGRDKNTGAESERPIIVLFPTMGSGASPVSSSGAGHSRTRCRATPTTGRWPAGSRWPGCTPRCSTRTARATSKRSSRRRTPRSRQAFATMWRGPAP